MKLTSKYALLDVTIGREALAKRFESRPFTGDCPKAMRVPVTITGYIDHLFADDDGESQQFVVIVENVEVKL
jgi:hypothetical protein